MISIIVQCIGITWLMISTVVQCIECKLLMIIGTVSAKIAPRLKCYKNASRMNRYNFPTDNAIDFLFSTLHSEMV